MHTSLSGYSDTALGGTFGLREREVGLRLCPERDPEASTFAQGAVMLETAEACNLWRIATSIARYCRRTLGSPAPRFAGHDSEGTTQPAITGMAERRPSPYLHTCTATCLAYHRYGGESRWCATGSRMAGISVDHE